jgi:hypothetical protein
MNDLPSASDRPPVNSPPPTPRQFAAFIEQVWKPAQRAASASEFSIPHAWTPAWRHFSELVGSPPTILDSSLKTVS